LILFDIDHFKELNDSMGHMAGDQVLHRVAQIIKPGLRETDVTCRFGGEEFIVIVVQTGGRDAAYAAEKVRESVENAIFEGWEHLRMTVSAGISNYPEMAPLAADCSRRRTSRTIWPRNPAGIAWSPLPIRELLP